MNKKVIYIFLLCSTVNCLEHIWWGGTSIWKRVGVFVSTREMSERAQRQPNNYMIVLKQKNVEQNTHCHNQTETRGRRLSGANWHQSVFHFSWPLHQIHRGRPVEQITPFKQHRRKQFIHVAFIYSSLQRWKRIIHHDFASGQWPNSVNSLLSFLMHYVYIVRESALVKGRTVSSLKAMSTFKKWLPHARCIDS